MRVNGYTLSMTRGDTEQLVVSMKDVEGTIVPFATGDIVYFTIKSLPTDTDKILQKTITSFTDGKAVIDIAHIDTSELDVKAYYYDIQVNIFSTSQVKTIIPPNKFIITWEVTYE